MTTTKQLLFTLGPAILIAILILAVRIAQYEPLYPKEDYTGETTQTEVTIPIFPSDPVIGDKRALRTIIAFEDFGCPGCAESMSMLWLVLEKYPGKVKVVWKGLPVVRVPNSSEGAHRIGLCAVAQGKFESFAKAIFENGNDISDEALEAATKIAQLDRAKLAVCTPSEKIQNEMAVTKQIALALRIQAVPTLFIDNKQIEPPRSLEGWETLLGLR